MTQEDKNLLLKDLCARLPYGTMLNISVNLFTDETFNARISTIDYCGEIKVRYGFEEYEQVYSLEQIKPYLFPLSSMTKEQYKEWCDLEAEPLEEILGRNKMSTLEHHLLIAKSLIDPVNYCYKNHFDIYGLIEKGLAIDATNLNIY